MNICMELSIHITCNGLAADIHTKDMTRLKQIIESNLDRLSEFGVYTNTAGTDVWYHIALKTDPSKHCKQWRKHI